MYIIEVKETKVKYTVALPVKIAKKLEELSVAESMSKPETLRRAISLYSYIYREVVQEDMKLCIVDKDDKIQKEIVMS